MAEEKKEKMVTVKLIPRYKGETQRYVSINNRSFLIQTNKNVDVPEYVAIALAESDTQRQEAEEKQDAMAID